MSSLPIEPRSARERRVFCAAALTGAASLLLDQGTKIWIEAAMRLNESIPVVDGYFSITSVRNYGAAWSILSGHGWFLLLIAAAVTVLCVLFFRYLTSGWQERYFAVFLVLAGVAGNSIDRIWRGAVVDFLDFHYHAVWHYPVFNVADISICVGMGLYILSDLLRPELKKTPPDGAETDHADRDRV